ncbi:hypothetical protein pb186bvf_001435 [Paramecium bursaria]
MFKILLIMLIFVFGVLAQTQCQLQCKSPYYARDNRCCTRRFRSSDGVCTGSLVDPGGQVLIVFYHPSTLGSPPACCINSQGFQIKKVRRGCGCGKYIDFWKILTIIIRLDQITYLKIFVDLSFVLMFELRHLMLYYTKSRQNYLAFFNQFRRHYEMPDYDIYLISNLTYIYLKNELNFTMQEKIQFKQFNINGTNLLQLLQWNKKE